MINQARISVLVVLLSHSVFSFADDNKQLGSAILKADPASVVGLRRESQALADSQYQPIENPPETLSDTTEIKLVDNESVPAVYLYKLQPTTVQFVDITGAPWPIADTKGFDGNFIKIKQVLNNQNNSLWASPNNPLGFAFVSVYLKGENTPITLKFEANKKKYHTSKIIKITKLGPNAVVDRDSALLANQAGLETDEELESAAYGIRPNNFSELETHNESVVAWENGKNILVYTPLDPLVPGPIRVKVGARDWKAYRLPITSRITFTNKTGGLVEVLLEKKYVK